MENKSTIVVTGFGPFGVHTKNASWEAVKLLPNLNLEEECEVRLIIKEILVAYDEVDTTVPELWNEHQPLLVVHVGVSNMVNQVVLESCANKSGYCKSDVKECKLVNGCNMAGDIERLKTNLDLSRISKEAKELSVDVCVSDDAGRYLCEYIYYTSLNISASNTIFIHVPMISEKYPVSKIADQIKLIIKLALKQLQESS